MYRTAILAALIACAVSPPALAKVVSAPVYRHAGAIQPGIGVFCLNLDNTACQFGGGSGSSAAPPASSAIGVQRTTGIGTTGALVSAADTTNRRTVTNTSAIACELMGGAAAYGTGYPLPAGGSFTFDASGRTTAALYVACASAGGTVAVLSY